MQKIKCKAVLFDLWNTLAGSGGTMQRTQQKMGLGHYSFGFFVKRFEKATMQTRFGSIKEFLEAAFLEFDIEPKKQKLEYLERLWCAQMKNAKLFPETKSVLCALKKRGFKLGIVSNCQYFGVRALLKRLKIEQFFDSIQLSSETGSLKPEPEMFLRAIIKLRLKPSEAIIVGDAQADINGALNAKMRGILLDRRARKKKYYKAVAVINSLSELLELLEVEKNGNN